MVITPAFSPQTCVIPFTLVVGGTNLSPSVVDSRPNYLILNIIIALVVVRWPRPPSKQTANIKKITPNFRPKQQQNSSSSDSSDVIFPVARAHAVALTLFVSCGRQTSSWVRPTITRPIPHPDKTAINFTTAVPSAIHLFGLWRASPTQSDGSRVNLGDVNPVLVHHVVDKILKRKRRLPVVGQKGG